MGGITANLHGLWDSLWNRGARNDTYDVLLYEPGLGGSEWDSSGYVFLGSFIARAPREAVDQALSHLAENPYNSVGEPVPICSEAPPEIIAVPATYMKPVEGVSVPKAINDAFWRYADGGG